MRLRDRAERLAVAIALGTCISFAPARSAEGAGISEEDRIEAEVRGRLRAVPGTSAEHTGFQITAGQVTWEVDASHDDALLRTAGQLDGQVAIAKGTYSERRSGSRVRRLLRVRTLAPASGNGRDGYVDVTVRGMLRHGVMAIGTETTGVTITAGAVTWELELRKLRARASTLDGRKAIVSGRLRRAAGVEVRNRYVVEVRAVKPA